MTDITAKASELPELPERDGDWAGDDWFTKDSMIAYGLACITASQAADAVQRR